MINLKDNKVVLVRSNENYPENSDKKYIFTIGEIAEVEEDENLQAIVNAEVFLVDAINSDGAIVLTWSGISPNGLYKHHFLFVGKSFDVVQNENAIVGIISNQEVEEKSEETEETEKVSQVEETPETEVGNEEPQADMEVIKDEE
jgi:hypothetical protein